MGRVFAGVPQELALKLRDACDIGTFIETGTFQGATASWAADHFKQVFTIEGWREYHEKAKAAYSNKKNANFLYGDSRDQLPKVLKSIQKPALLWLDAHYLGNTMNSVGTPGECALREELDAIGSNGMRHFILIDDLHCFEGELNRGSFRELWPTVEEIHGRILAAFPDYFVVDFEDVIIGVPSEAKTVVEEYMQYPGLRWLVPTSNKYVGYLNPFSYLFNKFVGARQSVDVMRYDVRPPKLPQNFQNIAIGNQADYSWTSGLAAYLNLPKTPRHFVLMLEDYWIAEKVDLQLLQIPWRYIQSHPEVGKIDLSGDRMKFPYHDYDVVDGIALVEAEQDAQFRASIQAAIWNRDYLRQCCEKGAWSAWQFEKHGAQQDGTVILGVKEPLIRYVNAIGGEGKAPDRYDHRKIPRWMWDELVKVRMVA